MPNIERTGWRDQEISERHRLWGDDLYSVDIDFCMVEYYSRRGVLMVDYKNWMKKESLYIHTASHDTLSWLADGRNLPFCIVLYNFDTRPRTFEVIPVNDAAKAYFGTRQILNEEQWVRHQYHLRGLAMTDRTLNILEKLKYEATVKN